MQNKSVLSTQSAEKIAITGLGYLAGEPDYLSRFVALTGMDVGELRKAAAEPAFLVGVLDFYLGDEKTLLAFARETNTNPDDISIARQVLAGPENFEG